MTDDVSPVECYDFEVELVGITPRIWRRFRLPTTTTFSKLHRAIQDAAGWLDYHLYEFFAPSKPGSGTNLWELGYYGGERIRLAGNSGQFDEENGEEPPPEPTRRLSGWFGKNPECFYLYDFGDSWLHRVVCHDVVAAPARTVRELTGGERAFPREDSGGTSSHAKLCELLARHDAGATDLDDQERWLVQWAEDWRPDKFDLAAAKRKFDQRRAARPDRR